ncbi:MAG: pyruvate dehydrogenase complex dihydrolipoamide acetyltransferase [Pseudomonadota bacterium]
MPIEITMPALSPTMEEGNLSKWLVKEGDQVTAGDVIAEIETDKATMEVEAVDEGTIAKIHVAEGTEGVKVNSVIAILAEEGEDVADVASVTTGAPEPEKVTGAEPAASETGIKVEAPAAPDVAPPAPPKAEPKAEAKGDRVFASPLARRIAEQRGIDLKTVMGSGPHGRIVKKDIERVSELGAEVAAKTEKAGTPDSVLSSLSTPASAASTAQTAMTDDQVLGFYQEGEYELLKHDSMRKTIASRLTESSQTIPSYFLSMDCKLDAMLALRKDINAAAPIGEDERPGYKVSVNDFIIKAMALALRDIPMANASWTSSARVLHKHSDVGVAVAIPDGLITPIVRKAETKTLSAISNEMKDLASRARNKKLTPDEYQGGSTAVSNLGMFGVSNFTSIINPPHASIVSVGAGEQKAIVTDGAVATATIMTATFAFDHRVIDGALGAQLAGAFKNYMEKPMGMLV